MDSTPGTFSGRLVRQKTRIGWVLLGCNSIQLYSALLLLLFIVALNNKHQTTVVQIEEINEIVSLREYRGASLAVTSKEPSRIKINSNKTKTSLNYSSVTVPSNQCRTVNLSKLRILTKLYLIRQVRAFLPIGERILSK